MPDLRNPWQWRWMPTTVFWIGMLSIILLLWVGWISEKQRSATGLVETVMNVQIRTATFHLWLEQAIAGDTEVDVTKIMDDMDQTIILTDLSRARRKYDLKWILTPSTDPNLGVRGEEIKSLLVKLKTIGLSRLRKPEQSGLGTSTDRQFDNVFKEILAKAKVWENGIRADQTRNQENSRRLFLSILIIWMSIVVAATMGLWSRERRRKRDEKELLEANERLLAQSEELTEHREHLAALVEIQTAELTLANELLRAEIAEHKQTVEMLKETDRQIRHLDSRLINAQEVERRRISMELHDELGQALNAMKLHIRAIEKKLKEDQRSIKEECEILLGYMDNVIEDVRRLSLALSPTVLEDLGLTSALRWLISGLSKIPDMKTTVDIEEIDHFLPRNHWITVYRVIQEAITNIARHSSAETVLVDINSRDNCVFFLLEDDGKGFNLEQQAGKDMDERGLGLATMTERVRAMGGVLDVCSQEMQGTRIAFSIPVEKKEV